MAQQDLGELSDIDINETQDADSHLEVPEGIETAEIQEADTVCEAEYVQESFVIDDIKYMVDEYGLVEIHTEAFGTVNFVPTYYYAGPRLLALFLEKNGEIIFEIFK